MLKITLADREAIHHHLMNVYPEEGCGLLLGKIAEDAVVVTLVIATKNAWTVENQSPVEQHRSKCDRYEIEPKEMLAAMKLARSENLEIIGIYHSHPDHPARPSESDRQLAWAQYIYLICSVEGGIVTNMTAWRLDDREQFCPYPMRSL
jgi:proteasome lid subunit RPN8/RPN11